MFTMLSDSNEATKLISSKAINKELAPKSNFRSQWNLHFAINIHNMNDILAPRTVTISTGIE